MKTKIIAASMLFASLATITKSSAQFVNNGSNILIEANANIYIEGTLLNQADGLIDNKGKLQVGGDWINNASTAALVQSTGTVDIMGINQTIGGSTSTDFHNLTVSNSGIKTIEVLTMVGRGAGVFDIGDATIQLTGDTLLILNPASNAILRNTGMIISENSVSKGAVHWGVGSNTGMYVFTFGTMANAYIPVNVAIIIAGMGSGTITASTYPTSANNRPYPNGVSNLNLNNKSDSLAVVNRFWLVGTTGFTTNPVTNITFSYDDTEDLKPSASIIEDSLVAIKWDAGIATWSTVAGSVNVSTKTVTANMVSNGGYFSLWSKSADKLTSINGAKILSQGAGVYPNPTNGEATLELFSKEKSVVFLQFFNATGKLIFEQKKEINSGANQLYFNLNNHPAGMYYIVVNSTHQRLTTKVLLTE